MWQSEAVDRRGKENTMAKSKKTQTVDVPTLGEVAPCSVVNMLYIYTRMDA